MPNTPSVSVLAADVPGLPVLPGVARSDSLHQPARLHVLQRLVHVSEHQLGGGSQPLSGPASVWYVPRWREISLKRTDGCAVSTAHTGFYYWDSEFIISALPCVMILKLMAFTCRMFLMVQPGYNAEKRIRLSWLSGFKLGELWPTYEHIHTENNCRPYWSVSGGIIQTPTISVTFWKEKSIFPPAGVYGFLIIDRNCSDCSVRASLKQCQRRNKGPHNPGRHIFLHWESTYWVYPPAQCRRVGGDSPKYQTGTHDGKTSVCATKLPNSQ